MDHSLFSIRQYAEEAAEACNKDVKRFQKSSTHKISWEAVNLDLMHKLLVLSDLYVASSKEEWK